MYTESSFARRCMSILKYVAVCGVACFLSAAVSLRVVQIVHLNEVSLQLSASRNQIQDLEEQLGKMEQKNTASPLSGKKIVYDGDSIAQSRENNGGGYPQLIADLTGSTYVNFARGGAYLCASEDRHSVVNNLENLPEDGDLYCFEGGINDFWNEIPLGECVPGDYTGVVDPGTVSGAMETIFRYCLEHFPGKPVCFVITHKIDLTGTRPNDLGDTFLDYRDTMIAVCEKYSIPYYDAYMESGLNGWNETQNTLFLNANDRGEADGCHPNEEGYRRYYVPQLIDLFERMLPGV